VIELDKKRTTIIMVSSLLFVLLISVFIKAHANGSLPFFKNDVSNILVASTLPGGPEFVRNDETTGVTWLGANRYPTIFQGSYLSFPNPDNDNRPFPVWQTKKHLN
jgi:hypothetical protein